MNAEPLLPVGKDCDCGHPLVWRGRRQLCAVYGAHIAAPEAPRSQRIHLRDIDVILAEINRRHPILRAVS